MQTPIAMNTETKPSPRRKRAPLFVGKSFSLPVGLVRALEERADQEFGGNQSALVTNALSRELGVDVSKEVMPA